MTERQVKKKYRFTDDVWATLGEDDGLVERIEAEKLRRIRDGSAARELAQQAFIAAPNVLGSIPPLLSTEKRIEQSFKNLELLLDWLINRWTKNSRIQSPYEIFRHFGPGSVQDKKVALNLMQILVTRGWAARAKAHRYDMKRWEVARGPMARPQPHNPDCATVQAYRESS